MKRFIKYALIAVAVAVAGILVLGVAFFGFLYWGLTHDNIEQTSGPVTREQAMKHHCPIPLPVGAHDIQFASFTSGLQCAEFFVRFVAPVSECRVFAQTLLDKHAKEDPRHTVIEFRETSNPGAEESYCKLRAEWFDTDRVSKWIVAGHGTSWEPRILIDQERGIFYYHVTD